MQYLRFLAANTRFPSSSHSSFMSDHNPIIITIITVAKTMTQELLFTIFRTLCRRIPSLRSYDEMCLAPLRNTAHYGTHPLFCLKYSTAQHGRVVQHNTGTSAAAVAHSQFSGTKKLLIFPWSTFFFSLEFFKSTLCITNLPGHFHYFQLLR